MPSGKAATASFPNEYLVVDGFISLLDSPTKWNRVSEINPWGKNLSDEIHPVGRKQENSGTQLV